MKKLIYLFSILCVTLFSCQEENSFEGGERGNQTATEFTLTIPEYKVANTRAASENTINNLWLLTFDLNGLFIGRVQATNLVVNELNGIGYGSFSAQISSNTAIVHFIGNYDQWASFDDRTSVNKDEREIIPLLKGNSLVFWGRNVLTTGLGVVLFRNQAKVTVESQTPNFQVTGYAIANYATSGTAAPFTPNAVPTPFILSLTTPTMPAGTMTMASQTDSDCNLNPKYMFEYGNLFNNQSYVIVKGRVNSTAPEYYYKVQFLDLLKQPYPILRNSLYKVIVKSFSAGATGSTTFEDAKNAPPSNNLYAEILKESTSISDNSNNILTVGGVNYLFITGGTLSMSAHYTVNGLPSDALVSVTKVQDEGQILSNLLYNPLTGTITASVSPVIVGQQQATFVVKTGVLTRVVTVVSSPAYSFTPISLSTGLPGLSAGLYTAKDQTVALNFSVPSTIPLDLFPVKCVINTQNLCPIAPNKDLQLDYSGGTCKYIYWATAPGAVSLNFKTGLENSDETITVQSDYFTVASVDLKARHFTGVSVNATNLVNYVLGAPAVFKFTLSDVVGANATYPLTVTIATNNLKTTQAGWTAVTGGYSCTYNSPPSGVQTVNFTSSKALSYESVAISAPGFAPTTISFDNVLSQIVLVTNDVRLLNNGTQYSIPLYVITSANLAILAGFTATLTSKYSFPLLIGAKVSDMVTLSTTYSSGTYYASYTVEQLLANPVILFK